MKKTALLIILFLPLGIFAQNENKGIKFENGLDWEQIKTKAKAENKYIFVDCFASWCGPCKKMDKYTYPNETLGVLVNSKFISVKLQMDSCKDDIPEIQKWYAKANSIQKECKVYSFPTFLFFSPEAVLVHKAVGYRDVKSFITLTENAADPSKQFYVLLENYWKGRKDYPTMLYLSKVANDVGEKDIAEAISLDFKISWIDKQSTEALLTKEIIDFFSSFASMLHSCDTFFLLCYREGERVDSVVNQKGIAKLFVNYVITKEEIWDKLFGDGKPNSNNPDWNSIYTNISIKYNHCFADSLLPDAKLRYYKFIKDWKLFAKLRDEQIKKKPPKSGDGLTSDAWGLNTDAWYVFLYCEDKMILKKALNWSEMSIQIEDNLNVLVQYYDTKSNLMYKLGMVKEAIKLEKKALEVDISNAKKQGKRKGVFFEVYTTTIMKMKKREPTWKTE